METLNKQLLVTLFDLAQRDVPATVQRLATELGCSRREAADGLDQLARRGLVRIETVRLTFVGLMQASGLRAQRVRRADGAAA